MVTADAWMRITSGVYHVCTLFEDFFFKIWRYFDIDFIARNKAIGTSWGFTFTGWWSLTSGLDLRHKLSAVYVKDTRYLLIGYMDALISGDRGNDCRDGCSLNESRTLSSWGKSIMLCSLSSPPFPFPCLPECLLVILDIVFCLIKSGSESLP